MTDAIALIAGNSTLLALWGALALQWLFPIPSQLSPLQIWRQLALTLASKVNKPSDAPQQKRLSGLLSWSLLWLTVLIVLICLYQLVWIDVTFHLLLLWVALDWRNMHKFSKQFVHAYSREDKLQCRALLDSKLNRYTGNLSLLGLGKAGAETLLVGYGRLVIGVLFWYALAGGIGAILYRLAVELSRCWSPSRQQFRHFGQPATTALAILDIVPLRLFALFLMIGHNGRVALRGLRQQGESWQLPGPGWLLAATGHKLSLSLGGPVIYDQIKMERPKLGGKIAPAALHLSQIDRLANQRLWIWISVQSLLLLMLQGAV
ncbi:cobalamin biosynthesis family protein [Photobacterium sp. DNB23_23_1]|uniref:Cobalamin biosynthesis family protein n=1 Tax=Photobacterium pectinilyticum TaxID=2906793 RepID=A0ABT1N2F3_9GAMM|nr:cobalamin biosynthesis family protein [Photobacterium sp. ZSDE20]MCQ1058926.1 cobalamin biosynthesis family protein [Photobacterium sp. ZSDE20]MDD1823965.1 cobalamin biosynthesis family protein [Photobacterium sp. ZSDE20]